MLLIEKSLLKRIKKETLINIYYDIKKGLKPNIKGLNISIDIHNKDISINEIESINLLYELKDNYEILIKD